MWGRLFNHSERKELFSFPRETKLSEKECKNPFARKRKKSEDELFARKRREYMANNWADDTEELPPLGTLSKDESTKTTSTPAASAGKTSSYVPPHLRNRQGGGNTERGGDRRDYGGGGGRRDYRGRFFSEK